jgi:hypothetical protein
MGKETTNSDDVPADIEVPRHVVALVSWFDAGPSGFCAIGIHVSTGRASLRAISHGGVEVRKVETWSHAK